MAGALAGMTAAAQLIAQYQFQIFVAIGLLATFYLALYLRAHDRLIRTPFGLEREELLKRQNRSMAMLTLLVLLAASVYLVAAFVVPFVNQTRPLPTPAPLPTVTASPVAASQNIVVDSSGCDNPNATLSAPKSGERIAGAYEVHGTANIPNLAFYKFEISGAGTNGEWLSLGVGTSAVIDGTLGSFDATAREAGDYAFRLVVLDSNGNFPPPCVVTVTIAGVLVAPTAASATP
jgi:hypothetical protein